MRFRYPITVAVAAVLAVPTIAAAAAPANSGRVPHPTIDLPAGFMGEGVAVGAGNSFYAGSRTDGRVAVGDLRAGSSEVFVDDPLVAQAIGLKADVDHGLLWVAGGGTGMAAVYELDTGEGVVALTLTTEPAFINDVVVTDDAAYFTNSLNPEIYRVPVSASGDVGTPETIELAGKGPAGDFLPGFNLNGIAASSGTLIVVNSQKGELYTVDPSTGDSAKIDLGNATPLFTGDGILLRGRTLYVLQNGANGTAPNQISVVRLTGRLTRGEVIDTITSPLFETATTLARRGHLLVAVNAQFAPPPIDPEPEVVLLDING